MDAAINSFLDYLKFEKRYSVHTLTAYGDDLVQFRDYLQTALGRMALKEITSPVVRSWLASLKEQGLTSKSVTRKISSLKSFFKFCLRTGLVQKSPVVNIVSPKLPKRLPTYVEEKDMQTLFNHVEFGDDWSGCTARLAMQMLYQLGLRVSELVNCKESQVDFSNAQLKVLGKGNKERIIPVGNELLGEIKEYIKKKKAEFEHADTVLLVNEKGNKLYPRYIYSITTKYLQLVTTVQKKSPHVLRHSFATHLSNNGAELNAVKELLGHSSLAATQVYTHNTIEKLKNIHKKAHPKG
ncbi:MAG: tyrosine-type recombinase/integrase [Chitinophagaceae bacterium]|nr:tyrosine-type recombinase/integrase [Chitinophagaceae bacterium]